MNNNSLRVVFFGTPNVSVLTLNELIRQFRVIAAVTQPDKPVGKEKKIEATPVKRIAQDSGIAVFQPQNVSDIYEKLSSLSPDMGVLFAYKKIIPKKIIDIFPLGILNIHPSLLPKYRGPSPVQAAILSGETTTGVSIIKIDEELDHGPIIGQKEVKIDYGENANDLLQRLSIIGTQLLIDLIPKYIAKNIVPKEQNHQDATITQPISRENGIVDWKKNAKQIYSQFRAYYPWPGIYTHFDKKRLKIIDLNVLEFVIENTYAPGAIFSNSNGDLCVQCEKSAVILLKVQVEGKKMTSGKDFLSGHKDIIGKIFG